MPVTVLDSLEYNIHSLEALNEKIGVLETNRSILEKKIEELNKEIELVCTSREYYTKAIDIIYEESLGSLKNTLNMALKYVMFDKNYAVDLRLDDKRGTKSITISVLDEDTGLSVSVKNGCGQGVRTIISSVLKTYYLLNQNSKILLLDEKYSTLSSSYVQRFFEFLKKLAEEKGMIIVMITHDERFMVYGDKTFMINDGKLVNVEELVGENNEE